MSDDTGKEFRTDILKKEYNKYSKYCYDYQLHIEKCYRHHIINIIDRNNSLKILNDIIRQLNIIYNTEMIDICDNDKILTKVPDGKLNDIKQLYNIYKTTGIKNNIFAEKYENLFNDPFNEIFNLFINSLAKKIGFPSIEFTLNFLINDQYKRLYNDNTNNLLNILSILFIPIKYEANPINSENSENGDTENNTSESLNNLELINDITIKKSNHTVYTLLNESVNIYIKLNVNLHLNNNYLKHIKYLKLTGYFTNDPLNVVIRTSQICNNYIYNLKIDLESYVLSRKEINDKFVKTYIRNSSISDLLAFSHEEFYSKLYNDYNLSIKLNSLSFVNLIKEFSKEEDDVNQNLKHMFVIIKILLLGTESSVNSAGLLYGLTKEKKSLDNDYSVSDIIYDNLNYILQIKLRKTIVNIKNELTRIKNINIDDIDIKKQVIACKNMPNSIKRSALEKIEEMKTANNEYYKQLMYVKTLLNYPWPSSDDDTIFYDIGKSKEKSKQFLNNVIKNLNEKVYGHVECKESIKELLGKWICNPSSPGSAIGLAGPPGVGKTLIAKAIGDALNIPFVQITLGGQNDGDLLHGHGYTYSGSQPGMIVKKMVEAGSARCIMYFDELDKACKKYDNNEIYNILIHITDPITNTEFQDRFFQEIKFPLNKVLFIFSYNDSSLIDSILMDRIKEIDIKPFKLLDKKKIVDQFILKDMCELIGFDGKSIKLADGVPEFIINQYTNEPGVRELKRKFEKIFLKLNIDRIYNKGAFKGVNKFSKGKPLTLTLDSVEKYLGKEIVHVQKVHEKDTVGVISGLFCNSSGGGGILPIQVYENFTNGNCKFTLKLTGSQRRVMRESVTAAFTAALHCIKEDIRNEYLKKNNFGLHIHCIHISTPKNGPSAGGAFAIGFVSRVLNKKIRNDMAITGEIDLSGNITKIGGLQYKLPGAKRAGVKTVLVSEENKEDIDTIKKEYPDLIDNNFKVILVKTLNQALEHFLIDYDPTQFN